MSDLGKKKRDLLALETHMELVKYYRQGLPFDNPNDYPVGYMIIQKALTQAQIDLANEIRDTL